MSVEGVQRQKLSHANPHPRVQIQIFVNAQGCTVTSNALMKAAGRQDKETSNQRQLENTVGLQQSFSRLV